MARMLLDHIFVIITLSLHYLRYQLKIQLIPQLTNDYYDLKSLQRKKTNMVLFVRNILC